MRLILLFILTLHSLWSIEISTNNVESAIEKKEVQLPRGKVFFGEELFKGHFKENRKFHQNDDYILNINDKISVKMWGAVNAIDNNLTIDKQGNIFLPEVGAIHLLGLPASQLQKTVQKSVNRVFNKDVHVYADVQEYQPISVYVTGSVKKVGLYEGLSTDSILQFLDKAGGISRGVGSFRHVQLLRNKEIIREIDLYDFLLNGSVDSFQFRDGDTLFVAPMTNYVEIDGDVARPYIFELLNDTVSVSSLLPYVLPSVKVNSITITNWHNSERSTKEYTFDNANNIIVQNGDKITFGSNYYTNSVKLKVSGEHKGKKILAIRKGTTLFEVLDRLKFTNLSDIRNIKIYKKRVALIQKSLLDTKLKELEQSVLTTDSASAEEAKIRKSETERILTFIQKARKIKPKGQLVLERDSDLRKITLEEGDSIVIPMKSSFVAVDGEVNIPNALLYDKSKDISDYIADCGGFSDRADSSKILLIKANGKVLFNEGNVEAGDSILVLRKIDTKNTIWVKDITQILYQIAIGAAVALQF